jgi:SAM-dependent methyltransferase
MSVLYNSPLWYSTLRADSNPSAREIVPVVMELVHPKSVVDMGCGTAAWLAVFRAMGIENTIGVDGDYMDRSQLEIPVDHFVPADVTQPVKLSSRFDLAACLEVAEHLPPESAPVIVESLCRLAPVVLFSAAIPFQGGTHHVNEQWPEYWQALFARHGYQVIDCLRMRFWQNPAVAWHYAQNLMFYVDERQIANYPALQREQKDQTASVRRLIHPGRYLLTADLSQFSFRQVLKALPYFVCRFFRFHWHRWFGEKPLARQAK